MAELKISPRYSSAYHPQSQGAIERFHGNSGPRGKLAPGFAGPYRVLKRLGEVNYIISIPDRRLKTRLCHVNALKAYEGPVTTVGCSLATDLYASQVDDGDDFPVRPPEVASVWLCNTEARAVLEEQLQHLTEPQRQDVLSLVDSFSVLFKDVPGRTDKAMHDVDVGGATPIKQHPYRFPPHK